MAAIQRHVLAMGSSAAAVVCFYCRLHHCRLLVKARIIQRFRAPKSAQESAFYEGP